MTQSKLFFYPGRTRLMYVYVRAWTLCCLHSTQTFQRAMTVSVDRLRGDKECPQVQWRNQFWQCLEEGAR